MRIKRENMKAAHLVVGQIKIGGKEVDSEGRITPFSSDYFSITGRETDGVGRALPHPVFQSVVKRQAKDGANDPKSLVELEVVIPSDHIDFFMQSNYEVWGWKVMRSINAFLFVFALGMVKKLNGGPDQSPLQRTAHPVASVNLA